MKELQEIKTEKLVGINNGLLETIHNYPYDEDKVFDRRKYLAMKDLIERSNNMDEFKRKFSIEENFWRTADSLFNANSLHKDSGCHYGDHTYYTIIEIAEDNPYGDTDNESDVSDENKERLKYFFNTLYYGGYDPSITNIKRLKRILIKNFHRMSLMYYAFEFGDTLHSMCLTFKEDMIQCMIELGFLIVPKHKKFKILINFKDINKCEIITDDKVYHIKAKLRYSIS